MRVPPKTDQHSNKLAVLASIFIATLVCLLSIYIGGWAVFSYLDDIQEQNQPTFEAARASAKKALNADPSNTEKRLSYVFYLAPGQTDDPKIQESLTAEGVAVLKEGIRYSPKNPELHIRLGHYLEKPEEATQAYLRAIALSPFNAQTFDDLGQSYERQGRYEAAIEAYQTAIMLHVDQEYYYFHLYEVFTKLGRKQDAGRAWRRYTEVRDANLN